MRHVAWSYSSLQNFENCPKRYYLTRVAKVVKDVMGEAALWGNTAHKALELRIAEGTPLPEKLAYMEPYALKILESGRKNIHCEKEYCFDSSFKLVEWFSKSAWCRSKIDVEIRKSPEQAVLIDWKFGKRKPDSDQLKLFAAVAMTADKTLEQVETAFFWVPDKKMDKEVFTRDDVAPIWQTFLGKVARVEHATEENKFPPRPSGLCGYCPVGTENCSFWKPPKP